MSVKEVLPAFMWAGIIIGGTSLALAWLSSGKEVDDVYYGDYADETYVIASPFDR